MPAIITDVTKDVCKTGIDGTQYGDIELDISSDNNTYILDWYKILPLSLPFPYPLIQSNQDVANGSGLVDLKNIAAGANFAVVTNGNSCVEIKCASQCPSLLFTIALRKIYQSVSLSYWI